MCRSHPESYKRLISVSSRNFNVACGIHKPFSVL